MLRQPRRPGRMDELAQSQDGSMRTIANWGAYFLVETFTDEYKRFIGRPIGEIAAGARHDAVGRAVPTSSWPTT